jgi:DNA-binding GntR family transcriptional regulator
MHAPLLDAYLRGDAEECARLLAEHQQEYLKLPQETLGG